MGRVHPCVGLGRCLCFCFCGILASPSEVSQRGWSTSAAQISSNGLVVRSWSYPVRESPSDSSRGLFVGRSCVCTTIVTTVTDCDSLIRGDQGPPNFCLHRVARMLRPALKGGASWRCAIQIHVLYVKHHCYCYNLIYFYNKTSIIVRLVCKQSDAHLSAQQLNNRTL